MLDSRSCYLKTPPCGVPQMGLIVLIMPRTSATEFLFLRKFHIPPYHKGWVFVVNQNFMYSFGGKIIKGTFNVNR